MSGPDKDEIWSWVNGYVICNPQVTASKYVIEQHEGGVFIRTVEKRGLRLRRRATVWVCVQTIKA